MKTLFTILARRARRAPAAHETPDAIRHAHRKPALSALKAGHLLLLR